MSELNSFPYASNFISFLFCLSLVSTLLLFRFFLFITEFQLEIYGISAHEVRLGVPIVLSISKEFLHLIVIPFFCIWTSQQQSAQKGTSNFNVRPTTLSPTHKTSSRDTQTLPLVTKFLNFKTLATASQITISNVYWSPQAKFLDCLLQLQNIKWWNFALDEPAIKNLTHWRSRNILRPHIQSTFSIFNSSARI